jgi:hypothetical protein
MFNLTQLILVIILVNIVVIIQSRRGRRMANGQT